jgi:hypothetical protein
MKTNSAPIMNVVEAKQTSTKYYQNYIYHFITKEVQDFSAEYIKSAVKIFLCSPLHPIKQNTP